MADSKIEWTDQTDNVFVAAGEDGKQHGWYCQKVSPGCAHCYAERLNQSPFYKGNLRKYTVADKPENFLLRTDIMEGWKRQTKRKMHFINSMTDTFAEFYPNEWVFALFDAMFAAPLQVFQVLTKRSKRMATLVNEWMSWRNMYYLPEHIWLGVSIENQDHLWRAQDLVHLGADARIFISAEPLLGPIDFGKLLAADWVIVGGESGPNARPMHPGWARSIRDQCVAAGVPFLFKQWGEYAPVSEVEGAGEHHYFPDGTTVRRVGKKAAGRTLDGRTWDEFPKMLDS